MSPYTLWYRQPATRWAEALPIGNGRMGAMVYGGIETERVSLSEVTCYSGESSETNSQEGAQDHVRAAREALLAGDYSEADRLCKDIIGKKLNYGTNLPAGDLLVTFTGESAPVEHYRRELDLSTGVASQSYERDGRTFTHEVFASNPDQVIVMRISTDSGRPLSFRATFNSGENPSEILADGNDLLMIGKAHESIHSDGSSGVSYCCRMRCITDDASITAGDDAVEVNAFGSAVLLVAIATDFRGTEMHGVCRDKIDRASAKPYSTLRSDHCWDHDALFGRVTLTLGDAPEAPTDERLQAVRDGGTDSNLSALMFQYGRYLLIASSRSDSPLPAHLQGAWNDNNACRIGWTCDMHLDINTQMNYWIANIAGLPECNTPLFEWITHTLIPSGRESARSTYGLQGWVAHVFSNAWGYTAPGWSTHWGLHVTGGAWIALHLWEHYLFTNDADFLNQLAFPVIRESVEFFLDYLFEDKETGLFMSGPSCSPENTFEIAGKELFNSLSPTCDVVILRSLFEAFVTSAQTLGSDNELVERVRGVLKKLPEFRIGNDGHLQEWLHDHKEPDLHHRHTSHLLALYPFGQICPEQTPELAEAVRVALSRRTTPKQEWEDTGWARALLLLYSARLRDGEAAHTHVVSTQRTLTDLNLMVFHPSGAGAKGTVYELDGNTGFAAGVAEMLLQSHQEIIHLLPALPHEWPHGRVAGLRARGGYQIDIEWQAGQYVEAAITASKPGLCRIRYGASTVSYDLSDGELKVVSFSM